jgi:hypothetical protein
MILFKTRKKEIVAYGYYTEINKEEIKRETCVCFYVPFSFSLSYFDAAAGVSGTKEKKRECYLYL